MKLVPTARTEKVSTMRPISGGARRTNTCVGGGAKGQCCEVSGCARIALTSAHQQPDHWPVTQAPMATLHPSQLLSHLQRVDSQSCCRIQ